MKMRFFVVLNRDGGTLRTLDPEALSSSIAGALEAHGHSVEVHVVTGSGLEAALDQSVAGDADIVMAGGGDGTISAAAARLMGTAKALAVLPAGTMNLFARSLAVPLRLEDAVAAFATGAIRRVDMASANGRPFVHQFSIGLHPQLIDMREKLSFNSRLGKILASTRAGMGAFLRPPRMRVTLTMPGTEIRAVTSGIGVANNLFGEGHLPYAEMPDRGVLGIYLTRARRRRDLAVFLINLGLGRWRNNQQVEIHQSSEVTLTVTSATRRFKSAIDGELCPLEAKTVLRIHAGALNVLVPADPTAAVAAASSSAPAG
jgi:diacylglycerol kinase family enzyme